MAYKLFLVEILHLLNYMTSQEVVYKQQNYRVLDSICAFCKLNVLFISGGYAFQFHNIITDHGQRSYAQLDHYV